MTSKATKRTPGQEPDAELGHLLEDAASAPPETRIEYRDRIAAHGADAVVAMEAWVEQGRSPGFAIAVLEAVGKAADDAGAASALRRIATKVPDWADIAQQALARIGASGPSGRRRAGPRGRIVWRRRLRGHGDAAAPGGSLHRPEPRRVGVPQPRPLCGRGGLGLHHALEGRDPPGRARVREAAAGYRRRRRFRLVRFSPGAYLGSTDGPR